MKKVLFSLVVASFSTFTYAQWQKIGFFSDSIIIGSIVHNANSIFIGTNKGVYLSADSTRSWQHVSNGLPSIPNNIAVINNNIPYKISLALSGDSLFAGTDSGLYLSTNNGKLWNLVNTGIPAGTAVTSLNINGQNIFVGTTNGIYCCIDNRSLWVQINTGLPSNSIITSISNNGNQIVAAVNYELPYDNGNIIGVYFFGGDPEDGAFFTNWIQLDNGIKLNTYNLGPGIRCVLANGTNFFACTYSGVYLSTNYGESWNLANNGLLLPLDELYHVFNSVNTLISRGIYLFAGTDNNPFWGIGGDTTNPGSGVYFSTNNGSGWTPLNNGLPPNTGINTMDIYDNYILAGTTNGLYIYPNISKNITVSSNILSIGASANSTQTFNITSDTSWEITNSQNWITSNITSGIYNSAITLTAQANPTGNQRIDTLTVKGNDLLSQIIIVTQSAGTATLSVSTKNINITALANNQTTFKINSNTNWSIQSNQNWLTSNITTGSDSAIIKLYATANNSFNSRTDTITISASEISSQKIIILQNGITPSLTISTNSLNIADTACSMAKFNIYSNESWNISNQYSWLIPFVTNGSDSSTICLVAQPNNTIYPRIDTLTISGNNVEPQKISVTQPAGQNIHIVYDTIKIIQTINDTVKVTKTINDTIFTSVEDTLIINFAIINAVNPTIATDQIKVYPNPSRGDVYINTGNYEDLKNYQIKIINTSGDVIWQTAVTQQLYTIDVRVFGIAGVYFLQIYDADSNLIVVRKIVILKFYYAT